MSGGLSRHGWCWWCARAGSSPADGSTSRTLASSAEAASAAAAARRGKGTNTSIVAVDRVITVAPPPMAKSTGGG
uniref:Uncharacterized protein n=1 Tax=Arundo donax TaxID=35708 RepID=A0A0A9B9W7_ARUDO